MDGIRITEHASLDTAIEEQAKEACREIFYASLLPRIEAASSGRNGDLFDYVRGDHSLIDVLYGYPPVQIDRVMIYPLRTYELIRELKTKENPDGNRPSSREQ